MSKDKLVEIYKTKTFRDSELAVNKQISKGFLAIAAIMFLVILVYVFGLTVNKVGYLLYVILGSDILILVGTFFLSRTKFVHSDNFKYVLTGVIILVVGAVNVLLPKHGVLAWSLCVGVASFYYSPKIGTVTLVGAQLMMLVCMYLGLIYGEWDANLFDNSQEFVAQYILNKDPTYLLSKQERINYLNTYFSYNRWFRIFAFYYLPRATILGILCAICYSISGNNRRLLMNSVKESATNEKNSFEIKIASTIQLAALPKGFPHNEQFELYASMNAAKGVGGDFYDFFELSNGHYGFLVADVSGKGIPAAMFMMKAKTLVKTYAETIENADDILTRVNAELCNQNTLDMFVTCWFGILNYKNGELHYVNAGHNPILIKHRGKPFEYLEDKPQFVLGGMDFKYESGTMKLEPGDELFIYTDGITEALSDKNEFYGEEALLDSLNSCGVHSSKLLLDHVFEDLTKFVNGAEQADDITMLSLRYFGETRREITIPATKEKTQDILDFVENYLISRKISFKVISQLNIVIDEIYSNIAKFAYDGGEGSVTVVLDMLNDEEFSMAFLDNGHPFNPLEAEDPDVELSAEDRNIGGLGIFIVKKIMNEVVYKYKDGMNILYMTKRIKE